MRAQEIIERVQSGETLTISAANASVFMRECERHRLNCQVQMSIHGGFCTISLEDITQAGERVPV